jgi:hypothetical protein
MKQFAHFGARISRQFDASSSLSQAARTVVQRHLSTFASRLRRTSEILESAPTWRDILALSKCANGLPSRIGYALRIRSGQAEFRNTGGK